LREKVTRLSGKQDAENRKSGYQGLFINPISGYSGFRLLIICHSDNHQLKRCLVDEPSYLKLVPPSKKEVAQDDHHSDPLTRFREVVLNTTESALDSLNRICQQEMEKDFASPNLLEEYLLLHPYLHYIKNLCQAKPD
jgi:hypothetical protein